MPVPPESTTRPAVMADAGRRAGVSHQTVSRVLNDHPNVRESTRDRVLKAIGELAYRRNSTARALVTRRSQTLGVVAFDTTLYGPASTLFGIEQAAREAGYFLSIVSLKTITRNSVSEALGRLAEQAVEGLIVIAPQRTAAEALAALPHNLPVVAVEGGRCAGPAGRQRGPGGGGRGSHPASARSRPPDRLARRRPAGLARGRGPPHRLAHDTQRRRRSTAGSLVWRLDPRSGYAAGQQLANRRAAGQHITAVFVANDQMALGLLRAFREHGIDVPGDVSVVGFDDVPEAEYFSPPLTTIRPDFAAVGRNSIGVVLDQIESGPVNQPSRIIVPATLVVRTSTTSPAVRIDRRGVGRVG
jgi:DNA-binding LacI/PurR family transcriptional regulator